MSVTETNVHFKIVWLEKDIYAVYMPVAPVAKREEDYLCYEGSLADCCDWIKNLDNPETYK